MEKLRKIGVKKSQGFEAWFLVIVIMFVFAITFVIINKVWSSVKPELDSGITGAMPSNSPVNTSITLGQVTSTGLMFDKLMPFIIIGLFGFLLISAGLIIRHPIMIFVGIIVLAVVIIIAVIFSNVYNNITESTEFASTKADMPIQDKFMQYLPTIVVIMAIGIIAAVLWSRSGGGGL